MRIFLLSVLLCAAVLVKAQIADSAALRQVDSLIKVSRAFTNQQAFDQAHESATAAEALALEKIGKESAAFGSCLQNRGRVFYYQGNYPEAEKWSLQAKAIQEKTPGKEHPDYAYTLNLLAKLYDAIGEYKKVGPLYLEALEIRGKSLGKDHPDYASVLSNLANFYHDLGEYEKVEPLYLEALEIRGKALGKDHPDYGSVLNNLAIFYDDIGNYEKAVPLLLEDLAITEKALGKEHVNYAITLGNLAYLYSCMGLVEKAEPMFLEEIAIKAKTVGKAHPKYAEALNKLASFYYELSKYEKAEPLFLEDLAITEKSLGKSNPDYAKSLDDLADLYRKTGRLEKAEQMYLQTKAIRQETLGKRHPDFANSLKKLAFLYESANRFAESEPALKEYFELTQSELSRSTTFLSEQELAKYVATFQKEENKLYSLLLSRRIKNRQPGILPALSYDQTLFKKGFLLTAARQLSNLASASPEAAALNNQLKSYRIRLAAEYAKPLGERENVTALEEKAIALEKDLARKVAGFGEAMRQVKWQEVQAALKPGEAAIEFINFRFYENGKTDSTFYAALVLLPGKTEPQFIHLFEEKQLDSLLQPAGAGRKADYVNTLYTFADRGAAAVDEPKKSLYELLWLPLEPALLSPFEAGGAAAGGVTTVYFSPAGLLHRLNLGAIPVGEEESLADRLQLVQLKSTRQLAVPTGLKLAENQAVLFGGIQFDPDTSGMPPLESAPALASRGLASDFSVTDSTLRTGYPMTAPAESPRQKKGGFKKRKKAAALASRGGAWTYLPGTEKEIAALEKLLPGAGFQVRAHRGYAATEEAFKSVGTGKTSPRVLHLATHGYFFPDVSGEKGESGREKAEPVFKISEHPMLRSGLILAGGNAAWQGAKTLEGKEDGVLTAYEISQMNLANTELVVLSACETGLGDIQGNEGVYGLQRAFKIAGAKYLIMSLWQVPDKQTTELMKAFYEKWLVEKLPVPEAFRAAQQAMRERFVDPYAWAGFVLVE